MCHPSWAHRRPHRWSYSPGYGSEASPPWAWEGGDMGPPEGFGIRRPLRFLAYKLELDQKQVEQLAKIFDELKTERAQASVDERRSLSELADAIASDAFDAAKAASAADRRVETANRLRTAVVRALEQMHAILNPDQRARLAYLMRSGVLVM
jgi:Spy/CpxP family protein refolding chaperone